MRDRYGRVGLVAYRFAFGEVWSRDRISRRDRSLAVISILTAVGAVEELRSHVPAGRRHGLTATEIDAAIEHLSLYVGLPRAIDAARVAWPLLSGDF